MKWTLESLASRATHVEAKIFHDEHGRHWAVTATFNGQLILIGYGRSIHDAIVSIVNQIYALYEAFKE